MTTTLALVVVLGIIWALLYLRISLPVWTLAVFTALVALTRFTAMPVVLTGLVWLFFAAVAVPLNVFPLRRSLISNRLFGMFRAIVPGMSRTEREALEAGTVWWEGELFRGAPRWKQLLRIKAPKLESREQAFLNGPVEELCRMLDDWSITHEDHDLPEEVWQYLRNQGFFGMIIPQEYGGLGFSALAHSAVVMKIASRSITAAVTTMVPNSLGPAELLLAYGTFSQKHYFLPRLAKGEEIPCFALTGPEAGSDAASMRDYGVVCRGPFEGENDVLGVRLNWDKRYITLGPVATVIGLAFKLYDPDQLLGETRDLGITLALVPADAPGVEIGNRHFPLNIPFQNGPNRGRDVFVPLDRIIGGRDYIGHGWKMLMETLAAGRAVSLPALSTGAGKLSSRATGGYARIRRQFGNPIGRFEGVQERLARMAGITYQMEAVRLLTVSAVASGEKPALASAIAKSALTERMRQVVNDAMDVQGGTGICLGRRNLLGRVYQALPISITVEGANILTRSLIVFGQGAVRCHPYVRREMEAALMPDEAQGARRFDRALFGHIGYTLSNLARTAFLGLTGGWLVRAPARGPTRRYYQRLTRMSSAFALVADAAMLALGGELKRRESLSGRLADALTHLYIASACLKHFHDAGQPAEDRPLLRWACEESLYGAQQSIRDFLRNFPIRPLGLALRAIVFPFGARYLAPDDRLQRRLAEMLLSPSSTRDRLTDGVFIPEDTEEALGAIEDALNKVIAAEPVERRVHAAAREHAWDPLADPVECALKDGIISKDEAELVRAAERARRRVITVDEFPADLGKDTAVGDTTGAGNIRQTGA